MPNIYSVKIPTPGVCLNLEGACSWVLLGRFYEHMAGTCDRVEPSARRKQLSAAVRGAPQTIRMFSFTFVCLRMAVFCCVPAIIPPETTCDASDIEST